MSPNMNELTGQIIGCAIEVHKKIGSGLLESVYHRCLEIELKKANIPFLTENAFPVFYDGEKIESGYRIDLLVDQKIVVELKSVEHVTDMHKSQLLTYLRMGQFELGLILNFKEPVLKNGIYRIINSAASDQSLCTLREVK
ncbi:MAG: hypothetical protein AUJ12_06190 [Alphaproteobacteria bacterium CG1_02_46_17]|nr:MAG: hypothetical protein AUJ12_06190 [Alphaproteobacteria bacterium CG1_02_46_17]